MLTFTNFCKRLNGGCKRKRKRLIENFHPDPEMYTFAKFYRVICKKACFRGKIEYFLFDEGTHGHFC